MTHFKKIMACIMTSIVLVSVLSLSVSAKKVEYAPYLGYEYDAELGNSFLGIANEYHIPKEAVQKLFTPRSTV